MQLVRILFCCTLLSLVATAGFATETIPPKPTRYFNDYARLVSAQQAGVFEQRLEQFERETSNQLIVAIFPRMESASSAEDYTVRIAQSWGVGQKGRNNGAALFCFMAEHKVYIQVGYGLEGALPDATCHAIIEDEIKPRFRAGDFAGGLDAATTAIIAATKGEYHGTGRTKADSQVAGKNNGFLIFGVFAIFVIIASMMNRKRQAQSTVYGRGSSSTGLWGGWGGGGSGSGWTGGGGGGGFSGGGGSFGGGGSGGSW